jgi:hypothetical protein
VRRGYWTGFFMGGLIGMLAVKAYGDQLMDLVYSKLDQNSGGDTTPLGEETESVYKPRQRYRSRRTW